MRKRLATTITLIACAFGVGYHLGHSSGVHAASDRVFELRTYTTPEGKLPALDTRFRDHTREFFKKYNMTAIGYWHPVDKPNTFIYILAHESREAAAASWKAFRADPGWLKAKADSEANGPITTSTVGEYMTPLDFSPIK